MPVLEIPTTITLDTLNERDDDLIEVVELPSSTEGHRVRTPRPKSDTYDAFVLDNENLAEKSIMPFPRIMHRRNAFHFPSLLTHKAHRRVLLFPDLIATPSLCSWFLFPASWILCPLNERELFVLTEMCPFSGNRRSVNYYPPPFFCALRVRRNPKYVLIRFTFSIHLWTNSLFDLIEVTP